MSLYMHFRKEEHPFVDQVLEWKTIVLDQYRPKLTDFLDPRQQEIVRSIIGQHDEMKVSFWGGHDLSERKRCLLYPSYYEPENSDFEIVPFELNYPTKFVTIEHRHILGALMNIGLKREKFGDIITDGERFQIIVANEIADFTEWNLTSVGKAKISLEPIKIEEIIRPSDEYTYQDVTVSSLRLDTIISEVYKLSRSKVKPFIESNLVKVNWKVVVDPSFSLQEKDVVSVRGKGRCEIDAIEGKTRKDKWRIQIRAPK
ncbi:MULTISPECIES: RNA-binding protein [Bacillaceae]|uniref:RNA-binding protein n=1 Tax=Evansella alkalicola TaxID=745819 RepID=A0ABS6JPE0_9BACI|nr:MULTISPECIES: RNA-binding protein [Bacillaceae]MBU9720426.1 RNA-binding protein [Bacillus alkalicola]